MIKATRDVMGIFADSYEIVDALREWELNDDTPAELRYWLLEAADHIGGLYHDACDMQRTINRLENGAPHASETDPA